MSFLQCTVQHDQDDNSDKRNRIQQNRTEELKTGGTTTTTTAVEKEASGGGDQEQQPGGVVTFLDVLPGPAAAALFGFLLSVKCNAHVTTAPDPRKMPQSRQRRTASSFLIIFQSCPRRVWQVQLKSEAAPPLSVLFLLF